MTVQMRVESGLDPLLTKVLWNRLISVVDESVIGLVRTSYSSVVRDFNDYCVGLFDVKGRMLCHSTRSTPGFIGVMPNVMKHFLGKFDLSKIEKGDAIITNDPWIAAGHLLDISIASPIFHKDKLVGFSVCIVHHVDIGGRMACIEAKDMFEEGLKIPPMKLMRRGEEVEEVFSIIRDNVRVPDKVVGDISAQLVALKICDDGVNKMILEYGFSDLEKLSETIITLTERRMRQCIVDMPKGKFANSVQLPHPFDAARHIDLKVSVEISGSGIVVDFDGSSPQIELAINVALPFTVSYAVYALKALIDPETPNNEGCLAAIKVLAPEGSILNCIRPAPTWARAAVAHNIPELIFGALASAIPERTMAACGATPLVAMYFSGKRADSQDFLSLVSHCGGFGASAKADGYAALCFPYNTTAIPVEITEKNSCLVYVRKEFAADTAGPGQFRGGCGQEVVLKVADGENGPPAPVSAVIRGSTRFPDSRYPVFGRNGGGVGRGADSTINGKAILPGERYVLQPGDEVRLVVPGGGGFGPVSERSTEAVRRDVRMGIVSKEGALRDYGVSVDG